MSLYDMYYSSKNKNYMFKIIADIVEKETGKNIINDNDIIQLYKNRYSIIFDKSESDNLSDINKDLIDNVGSEIISIIKKDYINNDIKIINKPKKELINDLKLSLTIDSSKKKDDSLNRFNYNYLLDESIKNISIKRLEIPKEDNILFSNPNLIIKIDDKNFHLVSG